MVRLVLYSGYAKPNWDAHPKEVIAISTMETTVGGMGATATYSREEGNRVSTPLANVEAANTPRLRRTAPIRAKTRKTLLKSCKRRQILSMGLVQLRLTKHVARQDPSPTSRLSPQWNMQGRQHMIQNQVLTSLQRMSSHTMETERSL